jgi:ABC-2 type transport system ATP-binding protein
MSEDVAVKVDRLYKSFKLPKEQSSGIKQAIINRVKGKKGYEVQHVLNDISFEIKKGEFFGIVGRNGSGKSTLLKLLAGIYTPDKGGVQINGSLTPFIELGVGFNPELSGRDNVYLNGALLGFSRKEMDEKYDDIVKFAELSRFMDQKLKNYSSGMQVRLAFSIATHADSDILIFDEVLAVGDARFQQKCLDIFRKLKKEGKTIILVSHSTGDVEKFCDRVLVVDKSKALGVFSAREAIALYEKLNIDEQEDKGAQTEQIMRWGNEHLRINKISFNNNPVSVGDPLEVIFAIERNKKYVNEELPYRVGLAFYDEDEVNISGPNSEGTKLVFKPGELHQTVVYRIEKTTFNQGKYSVTAAVLDNNGEKSLDHIIDAATINVVSDKIYHGKVVLNDVTWKVKQK